jgi:prolyl oligopeptidase
MYILKKGGVGVGWLERGGVKVIANIRGGGEYGPRWHQAALKEKRYKAYEDVEAVAYDLIHHLKITCQEKLACIGGSNGGLLVGNLITRPISSTLFGAAVCQVPLLDMWRYSHLLAGASWMVSCFFFSFFLINNSFLFLF